MKLSIKTKIETEVEKEIEVTFPAYRTSLTGINKMKIVETPQGLEEFSVSVYPYGDFGLSRYSAKSVIEKDLITEQECSEADFNAHLEKAKECVKKYFEKLEQKTIELKQETNLPESV